MPLDLSTKQQTPHCRLGKPNKGHAITIGWRGSACCNAAAMDHSRWAAQTLLVAGRPLGALNHTYAGGKEEETNK